MTKCYSEDILENSFAYIIQTFVFHFFRDSVGYIHDTKYLANTSLHYINHIKWSHKEEWHSKPQNAYNLKQSKLYKILVKPWSNTNPRDWECDNHQPWCSDERSRITTTSLVRLDNSVQDKAGVTWIKVDWKFLYLKVHILNSSPWHFALGSPVCHKGIIPLLISPIFCPCP